MLYMQSQNQKYHVLARGVVISEGHILVAHCIGMDNTFLPGGHVEFNEGMKASLSREIQEELGLISEIKDYIGSVEADFQNSGTYHQEINHLFLVTLPEIHRGENPHSKENHLEFYWIHVDEMANHNLQPYPVRKIVKEYLNGKQGPYWKSTFEDAK